MGLNLSPFNSKLCNFNCVYCEFGWTDVFSKDSLDFNSPLPVPEEFKTAFKEALLKNPQLDNITFSGNGEPTLHPDFAQIVEIALELKRTYAPDVRLGILSNSSTVSLPEIRDALQKLDFRIMKLDAGNNEFFQKLDLPGKEVNFQEILEGLKGLSNVILQTMLLEGNSNNTSDKYVERNLSNTSNKHLEALIDCIIFINPLKVQLYTLDRSPAEPGLKPVLLNKLQHIASLVEAATGILVEPVLTTSSRT